MACDSPGIAAISHHSAAYLHGLIDAEPRLIHVITVRGTHPVPPHGVIPHHTRALARDDVCEMATGNGRTPGCAITVTTPATTVVMLAAYLEHDELIDVVARALERHCTVDTLRAAATRRRQRGRCGPQRVLTALHHVHSRDLTPA